MTKKLLYNILLILTILNLTACAGGRKHTAIPTTSTPSSSIRTRHATTHKVGPGETLWRISKMYDVPINEIMSSNHLPNNYKLLMGQELRIPNAAQLKPVITLYPSSKWRYIIIHHSGTEEGSALQFHQWHLNKGWDKGVGYHFVIDNDQSEKQDGQIESTPRWIKQEDGAHCKAGEMNSRSIGICLVGNFDTEHVSRKQMKSLVYLINKLRRHYNIPISHIIEHRKVTGASTHCPGKQFPWQKFINNLQAAASE